MTTTTPRRPGRARHIAPGADRQRPRVLPGRRARSRRRRRTALAALRAAVMTGLGR